MMDAQVDEKVPLRKRIAWGSGGLADNFIMNTVGVLALPIYNIALGLDPVKVGIALFIARFVDAVTDPLMGFISDNTRSRWGRRRPYIAVGATVSALLLPLVWMPPTGSTVGMFWYLTVLGIIYSIAYTLFAIPYTALGYELTRDYNERTRVLAWRMYIGLIGSLTLPWLYKWCLHPVFDGDVVVGARWVSVGLGCIILITGLLPVLGVRERAAAIEQQSIGFLQAWGYTLRNRKFQVLLVTYLIILGGMFTSSALGLYINIYYVCDGDKNLAATIGGLAGTLMALTSYISLPMVTWISARWSKRHAMTVGLGFAAAGIFSLWWTMTPAMPYLQLVSSVIVGMGIQGCWLMVSSMVADICDDDERITGQRREGMYGAITAFALKLALAVTALTGGAVLKLSGYDAVDAETTGVVPASVIMRLRNLFVFIQGGALVLAMLLIYFCYNDAQTGASDRTSGQLPGPRS